MREKLRAGFCGADKSRVDGCIQASHSQDSFSMKLNANESVALVGSSGAGKSTIISLLLRFYEITAGDIMIDDNNIKDLSPKFLRGLVGLVAQEPVLFGLSILDNVRYGNPSASLEEGER